MLDLIRNDVVRLIMTVRVQSQEEIAAAEAKRKKEEQKRDRIKELMDRRKQKEQETNLN